MTEQQLSERLLEAFPDAAVDLSGEGCNFEIYVLSDAFEGQGSLERQRKVLSLFQAELSSGELHALSVSAKTHEEAKTTGPGPGLVGIDLGGG